MGIVTTLLLIVFIASAILLLGIVLIQEEQTEGLGGIFAGGGASGNVGNRSGNILTRATGILATIFLVTAFALAWNFRTEQSTGLETEVRREQREANENWWVQPDPEISDDESSSDATIAAPESSDSE